MIFIKSTFTQFRKLFFKNKNYFNSIMATGHSSISSDVTQIDGSILEGGGQILRISSALSCILEKPIFVNKIRANRKDGGLKAQHTIGLRLLAELSSGKLENGNIGAKEISLFPNKIKSGRYIGDTKTAGSVCLLMQSSIPCLIFADKDSILDLRGGTNAEHAPPIDEYELVFKPIVEKFGVNYDCEIVRRGYYPRGGGELHITVHPIQKLSPFEITDFGTVKRFFGKSYVAGTLPIKIAQNMADSAKHIISRVYKDVPIEITVCKEPSNLAIGNGSGIIIVAETTTGCLLGGSGLGAKNLTDDQVAHNALNDLLEDLRQEACVDNHVQDQLIIFMALADGHSKIKTSTLTLHTKTAIYMTELLTNVKFNVTAVDSNSTDGPFYIECDGIGHKNPNF